MMLPSFQQCNVTTYKPIDEKLFDAQRERCFIMVSNLIFVDLGMREDLLAF